MAVPIGTAIIILTQMTSGGGGYAALTRGYTYYAATAAFNA
jgi:hypothetical protein